MGNRTKFSDVDILKFMGQVVAKHTKHYQSDFEIDKETLREAANRRARQDKTFIWLCRTAGTWLLNEKNIFLKNTKENNVFNFYAEQPIGITLAFVIEAVAVAGNTVIGNAYALDYQAHYKHVRSVSLTVETVFMQYERGYRVRSANDKIVGYPDIEYGKLQSIQYQPHSQEELVKLLSRERRARAAFQEGNPSTYIANL